MWHAQHADLRVPVRRFLFGIDRRNDDVEYTPADQDENRGNRKDCREDASTPSPLDYVGMTKSITARK